MFMQSLVKIGPVAQTLKWWWDGGGKHTHTAWCNQGPSSLFLEKEMSSNDIRAIILCHELIFILKMI
jgi:hypothetical protein